jgi:hypothetical protein
LAVPIRALARVAAVLVTVAAASAQAKVPDYFAKIERIDIEPYFARMAKVRVFLNIVTLQGQVVGNIVPTDLALFFDANKQKQVPGILPFDATVEPVDLVVVVETGVRYASALEDLEEPLAQLLTKLPKSTFRAAVVAYGGDSLHASSLGDPARAARYWKKLAPEDEPYPPALIEAMKRAVRILKNAPPPPSGQVPRRIIFVISDGSNNDEEGLGVREDFNNLIKQALEIGATIHTLAFSMNDRRPPYQNLGQMSKKTAGTFRWARGRADFGPMIDGLSTELRKQLVLTYFIPPDAIAGKKVRIVCKSPNCGTEALESNERRAPQPLCAGRACDSSQACIQDACVTLTNVSGSGSGGIWIAAAAIGLLGVGGTAVVLRRRKREQQQEEELAAAPPPPPPVAQIVVPDLSHIPYLANNPQVQAQMAHYRGLGMQVGGAQPQPQAPAAPAQMPTTRARLFVVNGPRQGQQLPLRHGFTIGRQPGCDLVVEEPWVSAHHAQIHVDTGGGCTVVDLGSQIGTFVNGVRTQQQRLTHGMSVRVGQTEIRFLQG